jgi:hypothetical protein
LNRPDGAFPDGHRESDRPDLAGGWSLLASEFDQNEQPFDAGGVAAPSVEAATISGSTFRPLVAALGQRRSQTVPAVDARASANAGLGQRVATNLLVATAGPGVTFGRRWPTTIGGEYRVSSKAGRAAPRPAIFESKDQPDSRPAPPLRGQRGTEASEAEPRCLTRPQSPAGRA